MHWLLYHWLAGPQNGTGTGKGERLSLQGIKFQFPTHPACSIATHMVSHLYVPIYSSRLSYLSQMSYCRTHTSKITHLSGYVNAFPAAQAPMFLQKSCLQCQSTSTAFQCLIAWVEVTVTPQAGISRECPTAHTAMEGSINTSSVIPWNTNEYDYKPITITEFCNTGNSSVEWVVMWFYAPHPTMLLHALSSVPLPPQLPVKLASLAHTFPPFATAAFISS